MLSRLFKKGQASHKVVVPALATELDVPRESTILEWALGQGVAFPHSCRVGTCGTCKCRLISGKVYELADKSYALSGDELAQGYILACQSMPRSDLELELPRPPDDLQTIPVVERAGTITRLECLTHDILELEVTIDEPVRYRAGQYCEIFVPGVVVDQPSETRSYSFASAPGLSGGPDDSDWRGARGFVSEHMGEVLGARIRDYHVYMCGPPPMIDSAEKIVRQAGADPANIHFDKFFDRSHTQQRG